MTTTVHPKACYSQPDEPTPHDEDMLKLETLINRRNLHTVLSMISEICALKEQRLVENLRAGYSTKVWRVWELKLDKLAINCPI